MSKKSWSLANGQNIYDTNSSKLLGNTKVGVNVPDIVGAVPMLMPVAKLQPMQKSAEASEDTSWTEKIAGITNKLVDQAFMFQDKLAELDADKSILDFRDKTNSLFRGEVGEDGRPVGGYANTKTEDAVKGLEGYKGAIESEAKSALEAQPEAVRAKMVFKIEQEKRAAIDRGIDHHMRELARHEENLTIRDKQSLLKEIEQDGMTPFLNGRVADHLNRYTDENDKLAAHEYLAKQALYKIYNNAEMEASSNPSNLTPALTAYTKVDQAYQSIKDTLPENVENGLQNWLIGHKQLAQNQAKAAANIHKERHENSVIRQMPDRFYTSITSGNFGVLAEELKGVRSVISNPDKASDAIVKNLTESLLVASQTHGGSSVESQRKWLEKTAGDVIKASGMSTIEAYSLYDAAVNKIPQILERNQSTRDDSYKDNAALLIAQGKGKEVQEPPPSALPPTRAWYYEQMEKIGNKEIKQTQTGLTPEKAYTKITILDAKLDEQPLSAKEEDFLRSALADGHITEDKYNRFKERNMAVKVSGGKRLPFMDSTEYKAAEANIKNLKTLVAGPEPKRSKAGKENPEVDAEHREWEEKANFATAQSLLELKNAAYEAKKTGKPFSPKEWYVDHVKSLNGGILVPERKGFFRSVFDSLHNVEAGNLEGYQNTAREKNPLKSFWYNEED